jgi:hypothetical protein
VLKGHREPDPVAGGSALLFWSKIAGNAGFFAAVLILARALGPTGRGTIAFITVTALVAARLAGLGITEATTVFVARRVEARGALLRGEAGTIVTREAEGHELEGSPTTEGVANE